MSELDDLPFGLEVHEGPGATTIVLTGDLDLVTSADVDPVVREAQETGRMVVLDFRSLRFIDSSGLRMVLEAHRRAEAAGTRVVVLPGVDGVRRVFDLSGVATLVELADEPPDPG